MGRKASKFNADPIKPTISVFEADSHSQETEESASLGYKKAVGIELARQNSKTGVKRKVLKVAAIFFHFSKSILD